MMSDDNCLRLRKSKVQLIYNLHCLNWVCMVHSCYSHTTLARTHSWHTHIHTHTHTHHAHTHSWHTHIHTHTPHTHTHTHTAGTPGPIESPIARADSQTAITISWLYPLDHNDLDPLLLRFDILYNEGNTFNEATAQRINNIVPLLVNGEISTTDYQLRTLNPGTDYMVTVRASSSGSQGAMTGNNLAFVTTYGNGKLYRTKVF